MQDGSEAHKKYSSSIFKTVFTVGKFTGDSPLVTSQLLAFKKIYGEFFADIIVTQHLVSIKLD